MVTSEQLKSALLREPFQPFRVVLRNGRTFDIIYQESNRVWEEEFVVGMDFDEGDDPLPTYFDFVDVGEIDRIEPLDGSSLLPFGLQSN